MLCTDKRHQFTNGVCVRCGVRSGSGSSIAQQSQSQRGYPSRSAHHESFANYDSDDEDGSGNGNARTANNANGAFGASLSNIEVRVDSGSGSGELSEQAPRASDAQDTKCVLARYNTE